MRLYLEEAELNSLPPILLNIFYHYTESHAGDSDFVYLNVDHQIPERARRYAAYISNLVLHRIKLSPDASEVSLEHLIELLDWPPLGMILRKFLGSEPLLSLLNDQPPTFARQRIELVASLIDSLADKLLSGFITYGEFAKLLTREDKFLQLLDHLVPADVAAAFEKRERYSRASVAIAFRKQQRDRYHQQKTRLGIFVDQFKNFKEIGTNSY